MSLSVLTATPEPSLDLQATDGDGERKRLWVFSGVLETGDTPAESFRHQVRTPGSVADLGLYVPGCDGLPASHQVAAWAEVSLAGGVVSFGRAGQAVVRSQQGTVDLVDDTSGYAKKCLFLRFTATATTGCRCATGSRRDPPD